MSIGIGIRHQKFSRFLKIEERIPDFLHRGISAHQCTAFQIDTFYVFIGFSFFYVCQHLVQTKVFHLIPANGIREYSGEWVILRAFDQLSLQIKLVHRVGVDLYGFFAGACNSPDKAK